MYARGGVSRLSVARAESGELHLLPALANRHGCITGATGTGKTVTLQQLAEGFSNIGVPVFLADVKGDLSGLAVCSSSTKRTSCSMKRPKRCSTRSNKWCA